MHKVVYMDMLGDGTWSTGKRSHLPDIHAAILKCWLPSSGARWPGQVECSVGVLPPLLLNNIIGLRSNVGVSLADAAGRFLCAWQGLYKTYAVVMVVTKHRYFTTDFDSVELHPVGLFWVVSGLLYLISLLVDGVGLLWSIYHLLYCQIWSNLFRTELLVWLYKSILLLIVYGMAFGLCSLRILQGLRPTLCILLSWPLGLLDRLGISNISP